MSKLAKALGSCAARRSDQPGTVPGFYNAKTRRARDLSVLALAVEAAARREAHEISAASGERSRPMLCLDAFASTGVHGMRWLAESAPDARSDVVVALHWPPRGSPQLLPLAAMAAGKPVIVFESAANAGWPALDPQTWQPRGRASDRPIAVSIDPRDEEHSLVLAIRRLSAEAALRGQLGQAARNWWHAHATPQHASQDWQRILEEAALFAAHSRPAGWPAHLRTGDITREYGSP